MRTPIPFLIAALALSSGCSSLSPYSDLTKLDLSMTASNTLNPDLNDRPSPVVVRLLELRHPVTFENADFHSLYERPREVLGADLVIQEELELRPGELREMKLSVESGSRYIGVLAAYRDLQETRWRHVLMLKPGQRIERHLGFEGSGILERQAARAVGGH